MGNERDEQYSKGSSSQAERLLPQSNGVSFPRPIHALLDDRTPVRLISFIPEIPGMSPGWLMTNQNKKAELVSNSRITIIDPEYLPFDKTSFPTR